MSNTLISLASLVGRLKLTVLNATDKSILVEPNSEPAGPIDTETTDLDNSMIGERTTKKNHILGVDNPARNSLVFRPVGGDVRYGYEDRETLFEDGFLVSDGDSMSIDSPLPVFVAATGAGPLEVCIDEGQG